MHWGMYTVLKASPPTTRPRPVTESVRLPLIADAVRPLVDHHPVLNRDVMAAVPVIRITCDGCDHHSVWFPDETTKQVVHRWNYSHRRIDH